MLLRRKSDTRRKYPRSTEERNRTKGKESQRERCKLNSNSKSTSSPALQLHGESICPASKMWLPTIDCTTTPLSTDILHLKIDLERIPESHKIHACCSLADAGHATQSLVENSPGCQNQQQSCRRRHSFLRQACQPPPSRNGCNPDDQTSHLIDAGRSSGNGPLRTAHLLRAVLTMERNRLIV